MRTHFIIAKNPGVVGALWGGIGVAAVFGAPVLFIDFYFGVHSSLWQVQVILGASLLGALVGTVLRSTYKSMRWDVFGMIVGGLVSAIGLPVLFTVGYAAWLVEQGLSVGQAFETTMGRIRLTELFLFEVSLFGWFDVPITLVWICIGFIVGTIVQFFFKRTSTAKSTPVSQ